MTGDVAYEEINQAKASMGHIYDRPDPRAYFRELQKLGYAIPGAAKPIFRKLVSHLRERRRDTVRVLDLGCSYGVNAALLKHDLSMPDLYAHWGQREMSDATSDEVIADDRRFFSSLGEQQDIEVIGLDTAEHAVGFAEETGLLDDGLSVNLEVEKLPEQAAEDLAPVDLQVSTGCVGYVTEKSFNQLLPAITQGDAPWLANFVLRMFPFDAIQKTLSDHGYVTEKLEGRTFVQRRFASDEEQTQVMDQLRGMGIDPTGKESEGHLLAEFYLSRPRRDVERMPMGELIRA